MLRNSTYFLAWNLVNRYRGCSFTTVGVRTTVLIILPVVVSDETHYVYIVECGDGTYYTGYTTDVERRVAEHNDGEGAKYTRGRGPVDVVHVEAYESQSEALQREHIVKQLRRPAKERLVKGGDEEGG